jgi:phosphoglucosamine mutase
VSARTRFTTGPGILHRPLDERLDLSIRHIASSKISLAAETVQPAPGEVTFERPGGELFHSCPIGGGGLAVRTQVGDRYVVEEMRRYDYNLGGEQSGHLVFLDHATTGDGVVAALAVLAIMLEEQLPLSRLAQVMVRYPQVLVNVKVSSKRPLEELPGVTALIESCERHLAGEGRVLVRYSGTEPKARVMVEGPDEARIRGFAEEIAGALSRELGG